METPYTKLELTDKSNERQTISVNGLTHGVHTVMVRLFQSINGSEGREVEPLKFEIAVDDKTLGDNRLPIIWLGDYKSTYYNYEIIQIPFRVYDPEHEDGSAEVSFYKSGKELEDMR